MATLQLFADQTFLDTFDGADDVLRRQVRGAIRDMAKRFRSDPIRVLIQYQQFVGFESAAKNNGLIRIIEVKLSGGDRLLAGFSAPNVYLLDIGHHDNEKQWDDLKNKTHWVEVRKANTKLVTNLLFNGSANPFIPLSEFEGWSKWYTAEDSSEWVTFLDTKQSEVVIQVTGEIETHLLGARSDRRWLILGGPGTGKTVVLLNILQKFRQDPFFSVGFSCSDAVRSYLNSATESIIPVFDESSKYNVILFDDPGSFDLINQPPKKPVGAPRALVYAFDPLQLDQMPTSTELDRIRTKASEHNLSICYRQRKRLASMVTDMTDVLAKSSPYGRDDKVEDFATKYSDLLTRYNKLECHYPEGEYKVTLHGSVDILTRRIDSLCKTDGLWTHSPPILIVIEGQLETELESWVSSRHNKKQVRVEWSNQSENFKGVDFQHVVIVLSKQTYDALQEPFRVSGTIVFNARRLLRIPFSRARDSLSLFVW